MAANNKELSEKLMGSGGGVTIVSASAKLKHQSDHDTNRDYHDVEHAHPDASHIHHLEHANKYAAVAAFFERNPLVEGLVSAYGARAAIEQFLKTFPDVHPELVYPVFSIAGGLLGTTMGTICIQNPNVLLRKSCQFWLVRATWAFRDGFIIFVGAMSASIAIRLTARPDQKRIKLAQFGKELVLPCSLAAAFYILWNILSPLQKKKFFKEGNCFFTPRLELAIDFIGDGLFFQSIVGEFIHHVDGIHKPLKYSQAVAGITTGTLLVSQGLLHRFAEPFERLPIISVTYLALVNCVNLWMKDWKHDPKNEEDDSAYDALTYIATGLMAVETLWSIACIYKYRAQFLQSYLGDARAIIRRATLVDATHLLEETTKDDLDRIAAIAAPDEDWEHVQRDERSDSAASGSSDFNDVKLQTVPPNSHLVQFNNHKTRQDDTIRNIQHGTKKRDRGCCVVC